MFCVKCRSGTGRISACGGSGFAGGGGGRVSVVVFSWHHEPVVDIYGTAYAIFILSLLTVILDIHSPFARVIKTFIPITQWVALFGLHRGIDVGYC